MSENHNFRSGISPVLLATPILGTACLRGTRYFATCVCNEPIVQDQTDRPWFHFETGERECIASETNGVSPYVLDIERELAEHPEIVRMTLSRSTVERLLADLRAAVATGAEQAALAQRYFEQFTSISEKS